MRRRGPCPNVTPASFPHYLFTDNKTMLEAVGFTTHFMYVTAGCEVLQAPVDGEDLQLVEQVELRGNAAVGSAGRPVAFVSTGLVAK